MGHSLWEPTKQNNQQATNQSINQTKQTIVTYYINHKKILPEGTSKL